MDLRKVMIILDNKIVTRNISYCKYYSKNNTYVVKYNNSQRLYNYSTTRLRMLNNAKLLDLNKYKFYYNNLLLENLKEVIEFTDGNNAFYHVIYINNLNNDFDSKKFKKIDTKSFDALEYLKEISRITSVSTEDGKKLLTNQMKKIDISSLNTALAYYLKMKSMSIKRYTCKDLIFPFGCNTSQYKAVENAIYNKVSVVEGPPGTGKTQTILNIMANIIIRNMDCQIVSNNNYAIKNIEEKLTKYDLNFISALLGKNDNINNFVLNQTNDIPNFSEVSNIKLSDLTKNIESKNQIIKEYYKLQIEMSELEEKEKELQLEYDHFKHYIENDNIKLLKLRRYNKSKLQLIWNEIACMNEIPYIRKLKYIILYGTGTLKFYNNDLLNIAITIQGKIYENQLQEIKKQIDFKKCLINNNKEVEKEFIETSMLYLKKYLSLKYKNKRAKYNANSIKNNSEDFVKDYPIILSTTYSSRNTFKEYFIFDYIIMDESSQIDVVTGALALSSARNAVVIGDEKQLSNVVPEKIKKITNNIFKKYSINKGYFYSVNSFLGSTKKLIPEAPVVLLREHYRCHPKIIGFCNKKFYDNQLIIMTRDNNEKEVLKIIRTCKGNHSRDNANQRQVDEIKQIVSNNINKDIGIIAPYNNQVDLIKSEIPNIDINTVHKFQGREKDIIIISTVDDNIGDFVANSNILNVAISRAKKQLYLIVTGNEIQNQNIKDLIKYVEYNNMEVTTSKLHSVFDLLYKQYEIERINFYKKYNKVSNFDTENIIYYLIKEIIKDYSYLDFIFLQPFASMIKDKSLLNDRELKYALNHQTHVDFLIFNKYGKEPVLVIEVDGYKYHKKGTIQYNRDKIKDEILRKYNIPIIRLNTTESNEEDRIRNKLNEIEQGKI